MRPYRGTVESCATRVVVRFMPYQYTAHEAGEVRLEESESVDPVLSSQSEASWEGARPKPPGVQEMSHQVIAVGANKGSGIDSPSLLLHQQHPRSEPSRIARPRRGVPTLRSCLGIKHLENALHAGNPRTQNGCLDPPAGRRRSVARRKTDLPAPIAFAPCRKTRSHSGGGSHEGRET